MIIDASVAFKWLVAEQDSHLAIDWIGKSELNALAIMLTEVANALWKSIRRGELPGDAETIGMLGRFDQLVTWIDERAVLERSLEFSILLDHAIYDCVYLALAERRGEPLLTADDKFIRKASAEGFGHHLHSLRARP